MEILRLVGCENLISQRKEFIFNAFVYFFLFFLLIRDVTAACETFTAFSNRALVRCVLHNVSGIAVNTLLVG